MIYKSQASQLDLLNDLSFRKAFELWVLTDPLVVEAFDYASPVISVSLDFDRVASTFSNGMWPTQVLDPEKKAAELCAPKPIPHQVRPMGTRPKMTVQLPDELHQFYVALFRAYNSLTDLVRGGFLVAEGRPPGVAESISTPIGDWWYGPCEIALQTGDMALHVGKNRETRYYSLGLRRPTLSAQQYDGLTLAEAFRKFVLGDAGVRELAMRVEKQSQIQPIYVVEGMFWGLPKDNFWWPLFLRHRFGQLSNGMMSVEGQFKQAIADRMTLFLAPLSSGEVFAKGQNRGDQTISIPRSIWKDESENIRVHARDSSVSEWKADAGELSKEGPTIRFTEVELYSSGAKSVENPEHPLASTSTHKKQRPTSKKQPMALERMKELFIGRRTTKSTMWEAIHSEFPSMSKREFDRQWAIHAPEKWKRAGKPKNPS